MANEVTIIVKTKDDGGRAFKNQEGRAKGLKGALSGVGSGFKTLAATGAAFGALQIFKNSIKGASDLNESMSKTDVVFGKSASGIHKWAQTAATSMGISRNSAEQFAGSLGLIFTQMGSTQREAAKMSQSWIKLAADIASFNNANPSEVLDAMQSATRGEYDELQRYVPSVSAAAIEHEALAMSGKKSADALSAHDKLLALQKLLFRDTAKAQGDFARTSSGAANQQRILNAQWEDAQAKLGKGLLPILTKAAGALSKMLDYGQKNSSWIAPVTAGLIGLAAALKAVAVSQAIANVAAEANPYVRIATIILALGAAFAVAWKKSQTFRNIMVDVAATTAQAFIRIGEIITNVLLSAFNAVVQGAAKAFGWIPGVGKRIKESAKQISDWKNSVVGSFDHASDAVEDWSTNLKNAPKVAKLKGDIKDLQSKLTKARADLRRTSNQKTRAKIEADIRRLEAAVARAKARLASIRNKTTYIDAYVRVHQKRVNIGGGQSVLIGSGRYAHGGIKGAQSGGLRSNQIMVGESGRELIDLPPGSRVNSNPDTERKMSQSGVGAGIYIIQIPLDGKVVAEVIFDPLKGVIRKRGGKGSNSVQKALGQGAT